LIAEPLLIKTVDHLWLASAANFLGKSRQRGSQFGNSSSTILAPAVNSADEFENNFSAARTYILNVRHRLPRMRGSPQT
jgi:hypothetical protein